MVARVRPGETAGGLTARQEIAATVIAGGGTCEDAAKASRAGLSTVKDWSANCAAFRSRVEELTGEQSRRARGRMYKAMCVAIERLEHLAVRGKTEATQLRACETLLDKGLALAELAAVKERLAALEQGQPR